jgi:UDP-GlcNAc:undecaprenyl-phosphate GlcNAc-1-phosphate transferase
MIGYMAIFAFALTLAVGVTPVVRLVAFRAGVVDNPGPRKIHQHTIPLLGGLAIYMASVVAMLVFGERSYLSQSLGILSGATLIMIVGIFDDRRGLRPYVKLGGQVVAALLLVASGVQVEFLRHPFLNVVVTIFWIVAITNAMNLLDNMDGLSGGIAAIASGFFFLLAAGSGQFLVGTLAVALLGACLGFLKYNFKPASIFMGDAGSLFLGYMLATLGLKLRFDHPDTITWMIPIFVLGVPIFDTTLVVISRLRRGLNPLTTPGKDHVSHRLVRLGCTHREAVMALYLACGMLGMLAFFLTNASIFEAYLVGLIMLALGVAGLLRLEKIIKNDQVRIESR